MSTGAGTVKFLKQGTEMYIISQVIHQLLLILLDVDMTSFSVYFISQLQTP